MQEKNTFGPSYGLYHIDYYGYYPPSEKVTASEDLEAPSEDEVYCYEEPYPGCSLTPTPKSGHYCNIYRVKKDNSAIGRFLRPVFAPDAKFKNPVK